MELPNGQATSRRGGYIDWFAVDEAGHVGHFATAGFGPVPSSVLDHLAEYRDCDERILTVSVRGEATGHLTGRIDDWLEMARRGLFAYDWKHWSGPYERAATPSIPVRVGELPDDLRRLVSLVRWPRVRFAESMMLRPEAICSCE